MLLSSVLMATHRHNTSCSEARFIKDGSSFGPDRVVCVDLGKSHFFGDIFHFPLSLRSPTTMLSYHTLEPETVFFSRWNRYTYSFNGFRVVNVQLKRPKTEDSMDRIFKTLHPRENLHQHSLVRFSSIHHDQLFCRHIWFFWHQY